MKYIVIFYYSLILYSRLKFERVHRRLFKQWPLFTVWYIEEWIPRVVLYPDSAAFFFCIQFCNLIPFFFRFFFFSNLSNLFFFYAREIINGEKNVLLTHKDNKNVRWKYNLTDGQVSKEFVVSYSYLVDKYVFVTNTSFNDEWKI